MHTCVWVLDVMHVCMRVCVHVYMHGVYACIYLYENMSVCIVCMRVCVDTHVHVNEAVCTHVCEGVCIHACVYRECVHSYVVSAHLRMCVDAYVSEYVHAYLCL